MRVPYRAAVVAASCAIVTVASSAAAQPSLDLRGWRASTDPNSGLYLEPAQSPRTWEANFGLWLGYVYRPITLQDPAKDEAVFDVVSHQITADLVANVGIAQRVALGIDLPVLAYQTGDAPTEESRRVLGSSEVPRQALGDLGIDAKLTLIPPTSGDFGGFALALHERFTVPTGDASSFLGEGHVASETRLLGEYRLVAAGVYGALGVKLRAEQERFACGATPLPQSGDDPCPTRFGHELPFGLGLSLRPQALGVDPKGRITGYLETHGYLPLAPVHPFERARVSEMQLGVGARYALRDVSFLGGVETAMLGGVGNAPLRVLANVTWAPRVHDADHDGVDDDVDQCKELPEDHDYFQDDDGCPELDNDDDGVPDDADRCPREKEDEDGFQDDDGCPDPDNDGDRIPDVADVCPNEPGIGSPDPKKNGCPIKDMDGDGIEGDKDKCPDAAEDKDGFQDDDGCPDPDNDNDGIGDKDDACPNEAGIQSQDPKKNGCGDPDRDKDTLLDSEDKCPTEAEPWNGVDDADGCPDDPAKTKKAKPLASVKDFKGAPAIFVEPVKLGATGELDSASLPIVRAIVAELFARPGSSVAVGVRTSAKVSEEESMKRARAIAAQVNKIARSDKAAEAVPWKDAQGAQGANVAGVGWILRGVAASPAAAKPPAPAAKPPAPPPAAKPPAKPPAPKKP